MTWEIFLGFSALVAFLTPLLTVAVRVTRTLTRLEEALRTLAQRFEELENRESAARREVQFRLTALEQKSVPAYRRGERM